MRNVDTNILAGLESNQLRPFHLLEIMLEDSVYKVTDCDVPIKVPNDILSSIEDITLKVDGTAGDVSGSATSTLFTSVPDFKFSNLSYSRSKIVDKADISFSMINNPDMLLAFAGGVVQGCRVILYLVIIDDDGSIKGNTALTIFEGTIDSWSMTEDNLKMVVVSAISQWSQKSLRTHSSSCQWKVFKGQTPDSPCMYSGTESTCDRSYKRCEQLGNTVNFGGFRWLPSIVDKEIWWGR